MPGLTKVLDVLRKVLPSKPRNNGLVGSNIAKNSDQAAGAAVPEHMLPPPPVDFLEAIGFEMEEEAVSDFPSTIDLVRADRAAGIEVISKTRVDRATFLRNHSSLNTKILAGALTVEILEELISDILARKVDDNGKWHRRMIGRAGVIIPGDCIHHNLGRNLSLISDLHGHQLRLDDIITQVEKGLRDGTEELHNAGDLIHAEKRENVFNLAWSLQTFKAYVMLMWLFPGQVHLYPGNHDIFCPTEKHFNVVMDFVEKNPQGDIAALVQHLMYRGYITNPNEIEAMKISKAGQPQSYLFLHYLCLSLKESGATREDIWGVIDLFQKFVNHLPVCLKAESENKEIDLLMAHSFPKGVKKPYALDEIRSDEKVLEHTLWQREISLTDFTKLLRALGLSKNGTMIFGHNPDPNGAEWIFRPLGNQARLAIIHSNIDYRFGRIRVFKNDDGQYMILPFSRECHPDRDPLELTMAH